jgi:Uma2 family endonuclease
MSLAIAQEELPKNVAPHNLGVVTAPDGTIRLFPGLVRIPDVSFASWGRFPDRRIPQKPIPALTPDLAVEVLSEGNTPGEMKRKREDYFVAGVSVVWEVDPERRTVTVYTADGRSNVLGIGDRLDGWTVLPGFSLEVNELFSELDRHG